MRKPLPNGHGSVVDFNEPRPSGSGFLAAHGKSSDWQFLLFQVRFDHAADVLFFVLEEIVVASYVLQADRAFFVDEQVHGRERTILSFEIRQLHHAIVIGQIADRVVQAMKFAEGDREFRGLRIYRNGNRLKILAIVLLQAGQELSGLHAVLAGGQNDEHHHDLAFVLAEPDGLAARR